MDISRVTWRKSSYSGSNGGGCVEVAAFPGRAVGVRDSKDPEGPKLVFAPNDWRAFIVGVKAGEFDLSLSSRKRGLPGDDEERLGRAAARMYLEARRQEMRQAML